MSRFLPFYLKNLQQKHAKFTQRPLCEALTRSIIGTHVIFLCRRNLAIDILWPIFCDCNKIQGSGAVKEEIWFNNQIVVENLRCQTLQVFFAESFCESLHCIMLMNVVLVVGVLHPFCQPQIPEIFCVVQRVFCP
jgi:hypothetical protein